MSTIGARILALLFPQKCPICGTLTGGVTARLCPQCAEKLTAELSLPCPVCQNPAASCKCLPTIFRENPKLFTTVFDQCAIHAGFYQPGKEVMISSRLIYALKEDSADAAAHVCAQLLTHEITRQFLLSGESPSDWIFTFPPRSKAARMEHGFDQAERIARFSAAACGASFRPLFIRRGGAEQKRLSADERQENATHSLRLRNPNACRGQKILLIDDILTTGATMAACASLLRSAGADAVLCATVLMTLPHRQPSQREAPWFLESPT